MSDFNQPTRRQDKRLPTVVPPSGEPTRQTQHGSIERNPDATDSVDTDRKPSDTDDASEAAIRDEPQRRRTGRRTEDEGRDRRQKA